MQFSCAASLIRHRPFKADATFPMRGKAKYGYDLIVVWVYSRLFQMLIVFSFARSKPSPVWGKVDAGRLTEDRRTDEVRRQKAFVVTFLTH